MHIAAQDDKPSPEYVAFDIYDLTLDSLREMFTPGSIVAMVATTPCNDFSKLLELPREDGKPPVRPCLDGERGKKTLQLGEIHKWIKKDHQPFHIYENVDFSDHPHFKTVNKLLGDYEIINSLDHAYLNRKRVFFKNFDISAEIKSKYPKPIN